LKTATLEAAADSWAATSQPTLNNRATVIANRQSLPVFVATAGVANANAALGLLAVDWRPARRNFGIVILGRTTCCKFAAVADLTLKRIKN